MVEILFPHFFIPLQQILEGRNQELLLLYKEANQSKKEQKLSVVWVVGGSGKGKTMFLNFFKERHRPPSEGEGGKEGCEMGEEGESKRRKRKREGKSGRKRGKGKEDREKGKKKRVKREEEGNDRLLVEGENENTTNDSPKNPTTISSPLLPSLSKEEASLFRSRSSLSSPSRLSLDSRRKFEQYLEKTKKCKKEKSKKRNLFSSFSFELPPSSFSSTSDSAKLVKLIQNCPLLLYSYTFSDRGESKK